jgi:hypothetical protein
LETVVLQAGALNAKGWKLEGITIALSGLTSSPQQLTLLITKLHLPKPFDDLGLADVKCTSFSWQNKELSCGQGTGKVRSKQWQSPETHFSFHIRENRSSIKLTDLQLGGGSFAIDGEELGHQWQIQINAKNVESQFIQQLVQPKLFNLKEGKITGRFNASGSHAHIHNFKVEAGLENLTLQAPSGRFATEKLALDTHLEAQYEHGLWQWQSQIRMKAGALYAEPVYLEAGDQSIHLEAQGNWDSLHQRAEISSASYQHSLAAEVSGKATIRFNKGVLLENASFSLYSQDMQTLSAIYLKPFFTQTPLEGITLAGELKADFSIVQQSLTAFFASFNKLDIKDEAGRIQMRGGAGTVNWGNNEAFATPSQLGWQQLDLRALPIGPSRLSFLTKAKSIRLLKKATVPFLGGAIDINQFSWQAKGHDEPDVSFEGSLHNASLAQLSTALDWTPLSGTISGVIPKIDYHNKTLSLGGQLTINVFDGNVTITRLASSGLFTDFPKLHTDLEIKNLDLEQLTGKFSFGSITGKLSGFVRQLYMENWKPVTFFAWIGTPDDDDSRHRISQKAVKNIASIGGGGASDILSRSFLSLFETFGYDKIGLGCYLHEGVCQLMGVEARASGYAIITGGGLPRIDVIGYNPRVDWNVLMERLGRISTSEEVIIK